MGEKSVQDRAFQIRPMTEGDLEAVSVLENLCFTMPWSREELKRSFENTGLYRFYVAEEGGKILGYTAMSLVVDEADIDNLAVSPEERRRGIGRALLIRALTDASKLGMETAVLEVRDSNLPAISLYESLGFRQIGYRKKYYTNPEEGARLYGRIFSGSFPILN